MKVPSRAELGHFNFRPETKLTTPTICMSKNRKFFLHTIKIQVAAGSNQLFTGSIDGVDNIFSEKL